MGNRFFEIIDKDLKMVDAIINKFFKLKAGPVTDFAHIKLNSLDQHLRPALVIFTSRLFNFKGEKELSLAAVIQLIHMSSKIHLAVSDHDYDKLDKNIDCREGSQYPVLIGDYLYGRFFQLLCNANILEMLKPLSEIICDINEGSILRKEKNIDPSDLKFNLEIIQKENAELIAGSCRLGAALAGAQEVEQKILHRFGLSLGMAYGLIEKGFSFKEAEVYLEQALEELNKIPDSTIKNHLINFIKMLLDRKMAFKEVMVV